MSFPLEKYNYYVATDKNGEPHQVIATSTYAGKVVRGVAKCDPRDEFSLEKGKALAAARCNLRIARKRHRAAEKAVNQAGIDYENAATRLYDMQDYYRDASRRELEAQAELVKVFEEL